MYFRYSVFRPFWLTFHTFRTDRMRVGLRGAEDSLGGGNLDFDLESALSLFGVLQLYTYPRGCGNCRRYFIETSVFQFALSQMVGPVKNMQYETLLLQTSALGGRSNKHGSWTWRD